MKVTHCPLCRARKGKRACPAKGEKICAACCGSQRGVQIACPDDCTYLSGAHASAWAGRETEHRRDWRRLAPCLEALAGGRDEHAEWFILALKRTALLRSRHRDLDDRLLYAALDALTHTMETRAKGVLYEHAPDDLRAVPVLRDLGAIFNSADGGAPRDTRLLALLTALRRALGDTLAEHGEPGAFLDSLTRLTKEVVHEAAPPRPRPLIIEP